LRIIDEILCTSISFRPKHIFSKSMSKTKKKCLRPTATRKHGLGLPIHIKKVINIHYYELVYPIGIININYIDSLSPITYSPSARPGPGPAPPDLLRPLCEALGGRPPGPSDGRPRGPRRSGGAGPGTGPGPAPPDLLGPL